MRALTCIAGVTVLSLATAAQAVFTETNLINTSQILTPGGGTPDVLAALNFHYSNQSTLAAPGTINGVQFQNFDWLGGAQVLASGGSLAVSHSGGDGVGRARNQNTAGTISGANDTVLESIANRINYYETGATGTFTFSNLVPNTAVKVQIIGGDDGSFFNNWNGDLVLTANGNPIGTWNAGDDGNNTSAKLATFDATTNGAGQLVITANQPLAGQHAGIGGMLVLGTAAPLPPFSQAALVSSGQILGVPTGEQLLAGVNFIYSPPQSGVAAPGTVSGIAFQDISWENGAPQALTNGGAITVTPILFDRERFQTTGATINGPDQTVLESIANTINFLGSGEQVSTNLSGLPANETVRVQVIGGDAGSGLNNWLGDIEITANGQVVGLWDGIADDNASTASLATFFAKVSALGELNLTFRQTQPNPSPFAGIAGLTVVTVAVLPEPGTLGLLGVAGLALLRRRRAA